MYVICEIYVPTYISLQILLLTTGFTAVYKKKQNRMSTKVDISVLSLKGW